MHKDLGRLQSAECSRVATVRLAMSCHACKARRLNSRRRVKLHIINLTWSEADCKAIVMKRVVLKMCTNV